MLLYIHLQVEVSEEAVYGFYGDTALGMFRWILLRYTDYAYYFRKPLDKRILSG